MLQNSKTAKFVRIQRDMYEESYLGVPPRKRYFLGKYADYPEKRTEWIVEKGKSSKQIQRI